MKTLIIFLSIIFISYGFTLQDKTEEVKTKTDKPKVGLDIGDKIPNLVMKNPDGKVMKLYKLKGNYVLVDFWASWCGPCRRENPNVVAAYLKYNGAKMKDARGFTVFGVSLDKDNERWKSAIDKDGLKWKWHVSDLKGWSSEAAKTFKVSSIPSNYLIGPDLTIIAKNLRGQKLHEVLDNYVKAL